MISIYYRNSETFSYQSIWVDITGQLPYIIYKSRSDTIHDEHQSRLSNNQDIPAAAAGRLRATYRLFCVCWTQDVRGR